MNDRTDHHLLQEFAASRSEAAFAEFVARHVDLVYSAAVRLVADPHLAEDVTQSVFVALAKQAGEVARKLAGGAPLSGWLHVTTRNLSAKCVRAEVRRRNREKEAALMQKLSAAEAEPAWDQVAPHLDHALGELSEADRDALLLRFFERKTAREIGRQVGLSEEAAQKRITRALDRLRERFAARGVTVPTAAFVGILTAHAVQAAPLALTNGIVQTAIAASASAAPAGLAAWSAHLASSLAMTKTQTATLVAIAAAFSVPFGVQQSSLTQLRTELAATQKPAAPIPNVAAPMAASARTGESEADEVARLRRQAGELRAKLAAKRARPPATPETSKRTPGPTLLGVDRRVALQELVFAGNATPEAALQSLLAFQRDGDVDGAMGLILLSPGGAEELSNRLATAEGRESFAEEMTSSVQGVVIRSAIRVNEGGTVDDPGPIRMYPANPSGTVTVEILEKINFDARRVQFLLKVVRGDDTRNEHRMFGLTTSGWKEAFR